MNSKLSISSNRLFVAVGIMLICYAIKSVFTDMEAETVRQWMIFSLVKDTSTIALAWIGLGLIFDKEE